MHFLFCKTIYIYKKINLKTPSDVKIYLVTHFCGVYHYNALNLELFYYMEKKKMPPHFMEAILATLENI